MLDRDRDPGGEQLKGSGAVMQRSIFDDCTLSRCRNGCFTKFKITRRRKSCLRVIAFFFLGGFFLKEKIN